MTWQAIVPLKTTEDAKSRLSPLLSPAQRKRLVKAMAERVLHALEQSGRFDSIYVLSQHKWSAEGTHWIEDKGRGLNQELTRSVAAMPSVPVLVIHADLPLVTADDVSALLDAAEAQGAIAADRRGTGTNAVALGSQCRPGFHFGDGSYARFTAASGLVPVHRPGLALDVDYPEDLEAALRHGFSLSDLPPARHPVGRFR